MDKVAIRFGNSGEIDISGSIIALRQISQAILDLMNDRDRVSCIVEATEIDPYPYDGCLGSILLKQSNTLAKVSLVEDYLQIEGNSSSLDLLASWFDFPDRTGTGYHCHFEYYEDNPFIDPDSRPLIITVDNSIDRDQQF
jgi:hypothetical protein